ATATVVATYRAVGQTATASGATISGGGGAGNDLRGCVATATANVTPLGITGSFTAQNKVYDGNNSATVLARSLTGVLGTDAVSLTGGTATFADKNAAVGKTVTLSGATLSSGGDAGNYSLTSVATTTANITPRPITVTAATNTKNYDTTTSA